MSWVYIQSEPRLWTVGHYAPDGKWHSDSDHGDRNDAADRCAYLNGARTTDGAQGQHVADRIDAFEATCEAEAHTDTGEAWELLRAARGALRA